MAELRQSLQSLVERAPASPAPLEVVAARAAAIGRRRRATIAAGCLAFVALAAMTGLGLSSRDAPPGVHVASGGDTSGAYIAEQPGGYVATGTWHLTITRGQQVIELDGSSAEDCGPTGLILPGDEVRGSITGPTSSLRVGERFSCPG